jgi:hypothetical protein
LILPNKRPRDPEANHLQEVRAWKYPTLDIFIIISRPVASPKVRKEQKKTGGNIEIPARFYQGISREKSTGDRQWSICRG